MKTCITPGAAYSGAGMGNRCCRCFGDDKNDLEETLIASANTSDAVLSFVPRAACPVSRASHNTTIPVLACPDATANRAGASAAPVHV